MATEVFSNFVNTTLAGTIGPGATTFTVASGTGANLPQPGAGQFGRLIFTDQLTGAQHEVISYTTISGDTVSGVTRGASPLTWSAGDIVLCGPTAQTMSQFVQGGQSQSNASSYAPDTGSANAYSINPSPAIAGTPVAGTRLFFKAISANTGPSTLSVNGSAPYPLTGANGPLAANEIVANGNSVVAWNSTYSGFELVSCTRGEVATPAATSAGHAVNLGQANALYAPIGGSGASKLQSIGWSRASGALTVTYAGGTLDFPNATLSNGAPVVGIVVPALSITAPSAASLGTVAGQSARLVALVAYSGTTAIYCIANSASVLLDESNQLTGANSATISAGATSSGIVYSSAALTFPCSYRVVGFIDIPGNNSGWVADATNAKGAGGVSLSFLSSLGSGQTVQSFTVGTQRVLGTTYYNTTGRPILVSIVLNSGNISFTVNGVSVAGAAFNIAYVIPPDGSYMAAGTPSGPVWTELR